MHIGRRFYDFVFYILLVIILYLLYSIFYQKYFDIYYDRYTDLKIDQLKQLIGRSIPEINNIEILGSNKSFTVNKKTIYICAKDENGQYYDDNMLIYVMLHELAHVLCPEVGHTDKYKTIFKSLLERATRSGIYNPATPPIDNYCNY